MRACLWDVARTQPALTFPHPPSTALVLACPATKETRTPHAVVCQSLCQPRTTIGVLTVMSSDQNSTPVQRNPVVQEQFAQTFLHRLAPVPVHAPLASPAIQSLTVRVCFASPWHICIAQSSFAPRSLRGGCLLNCTMWTQH
jgi:hypothetical protein